MGAWGVKALQSDEGLELLSAIERLAAERSSITADELVAAARSEGFLGDDPGDDEYLFDVTALALSEILTGDTGQLADPPLGGVAFEATAEGTGVLLSWLHRIRESDEEDREYLELWEGDPEQAAHLEKTIAALEALGAGSASASS
ncbi:hypothetical protein AB3K78_06670 [Leucobacter sp. HNU]|uniref:hypothetical protein n=1 Tax=Leucobacter sp. HNU TaxID=3236805 RepID=UPI003A80BB7F